MSCLFEIDNVNFRFYSDDEFKRTAAAQITEEMSFDSLNAPVRGGLYDPRMGPLDQFSNCETCSLSERACPGHMGYIQLEYPAYHPRMKTDLRSVLHGSCIYCQRLKIKPQRSFFYKKRFELVRAGLFTVSRQLEESPDAFYGDLQEKHLEAIFGSESSKKQRKQTTTLSQKKKIADDDDSDDDENENEETEDTEKEVVDSVTGSSENRNPYMLTDAEMQEVDKVVQQLIVREAKKNGYGEDQLDAFFKSVVYDVHAPVHHERLLIIRELYAEISGPCPFCRSTKASWTSPDKSANKLFCVVPRKSRPPTLTNTSHLALQRIARAVYNQTTESDMESLYPLDLSRPIYMFPQEVYSFVAAVWKNDFDLFQFIYNSPGVDEMTYKHFFMSTVPVPPNRYRAPMKRAGAFFEHDLNYLFRQVIHHTKGIKREKALLPGDMLSDVIFSRVNDIQGIVNNLFDFDDDAQALHNRVIFGYKQVIEKKEGLMRTNMMGKRVNFSARSVILPDPMIHTNEVSVPIVFAKKLSFPEVVNDLNLTKLRQAILNGPDVYPGANALKVDGKVYNFKDMPLFRRKAMSQVLQKGNTVVMRHVRDGDMFLVNRQPSLHRVSMMAHKARVLSNQKTIRIHYANCKSYNADFDGDEMNLHIPQDLVSQSEARELVCNSSQYCSPTSGEPIRGLIQDHIVSGVLLTLKDTFLDREMYQSLVFGSLFHRVGDHRIETVPPCIMKPQPLWTGKQVITTILRDIAGNRAGINLDCGTKLKNCWGEHKEEETVTIRDNEVMTGIFDKNQIGASEFGIVHAFDEVYGHEASAELLTCFTRLTTLFLQYHGFTCGVDDLIVTDECNELRGKIMKSADSDARHATAEFAKQKRLPDSKSYDQNAIIKNMSALLINDRNRRKLDAEVKKALSKHTSKLISESIPRGLMKPFPANNMTLMTQSGAKGSLVNASQISCCLGLQEFEGRRVRPTVSGKTLPSFEVYDTSAISGGYVASRFLTGIKPQEYFFHCMAGRDGLIDTAVKTARSGYLQRCLIKALEDLTVKYDGTVRNEANTVVQFRYGGDSVDPLKSSFLHNSKFAAMNHKSIAERYCMSDDQFTEHTDPKIGLYKGSDPISSVFDPWRIKGSVSDKFSTKLDQYIESNPDSLLLPEKKKKDTLVTDVHVPLNKFKSISNERFMRSLINPGEAVGVIAAQSIGEPSTQMTLNTFHFAGLDVAHVTVGIPRLIELFMVGKTKTVLTTLPVLPKHKEEMNVRKFAASISSVTFGDALQYVDITEKIGYNANTNERERSVALSIKFDLDEVSKYYGISIEQFWETVKAILIRNILLTIKQYLQHGRFKGKVTVAGVAKQKVIDVNQKTKQTSFENDEFRDAGEDHEESVMDDNDTPAQPKKKQQNKKKPKKKKDDEESDDDGGMDSESDDDEESDADEDDAEEESAHSKKKNKKVMTPKEDDKTLQVEDQSFFKAFDIQRTDGVLTLELNGKIKDSRIFLKDVIHKVCQTTYLRTYTGIEKVNVIQQKQGKFELQMEGFNMEELLLTRRAADFIDFDSIVTNDVGATADTYGIEAAYQLLVNEMKNVFKLYGIPVDERHISLIAEHMTNTGTYRACNRASMVSSPGLLHKATFESSLNFLGSGTAYAETEQVRGPSAELIFGKTVSQGTGSFDIVIPEVTPN